MNRDLGWMVKVIGLISIVAMGLIAWDACSKLERVEEVVSESATGEARRNYLLAAERLLDRMGLPASSVDRLDELPPTDHVIVLAAEDRVSTRGRVDRLLAWVEAGGTLIVGPVLGAESLIDETHADLLLDRIGVGVEPLEIDPQTPPREVIELDMLSTDETFEIRFYSAFGLVDEFDDEDPQSYALFWRPHGEGEVAVLNDLRFLHNDEIGDLDHAAALWELVGVDGMNGVLLVHGWGRDTLAALAVRHGWPMLLIGALLLLVWAWRHSVRRGPLVLPAAAGSRSLTEHVDAIGQFLWSVGQSEALVDGARRSLARRIAMRHPDFVTMERQRQVEMLKAGSNLDPTLIAAALDSERPRTREEFIKIIRTLETLRRKL